MVTSLYFHVNSITPTTSSNIGYNKMIHFQYSATDVHKFLYPCAKQALFQNLTYRFEKNVCLYVC